MQLGVVVRNLGPESTREIIVACARAAERAGLDDVWVVDHVAIPPDDAEGSGGRYLDPLATLAYLAGVTERIGLGTAVLILPYRSALPTAKWIASLPLEEAARAADQLAVLRQIGVTRLVHAERYPNPAAFQRIAERLAALPRG